MKTILWYLFHNVSSERSLKKYRMHKGEKLQVNTETITEFFREIETQKEKIARSPILIVTPSSENAPLELRDYLVAKGFKVKDSRKIDQEDTPHIGEYIVFDNTSEQLTVAQIDAYTATRGNRNYYFYYGQKKIEGNQTNFKSFANSEATLAERLKEAITG